MATNTPRLPGENERMTNVQPKGARGLITDLAIRSGAMTDAGELSEEMFRFGTLVAEHCARLADGDGTAEGVHDAGGAIRAAMRD